VVSAGLTVGLAAALSGTASAEPDKPDPPSDQAFDGIDQADLERMRAQEPLVEAAERIRAVVDEGEADGFAGIGLGNGDVVLWWKGPLPPAVEDAVAAEQGAVPVAVTHAEHSLAELQAAIAPIADDIRATRAVPYFGVAPQTDGSGIVVFADESAATAAVPERWAVPADMAVSITIGGRFETYFSRAADIEPFWGGAAFRNNDNGGVCTAGFPVARGGRGYMLTAGHCGRPGGTWSNGDNSSFAGVAVEENVYHDLLLVSAPVANRIYVGNPTTTASMRVAGWGTPFFDENLCTSGRLTTTICNVNVWLQNYYTCGADIYNNVECYGDLWIASQAYGLPAGQRGDSGGPVFRPWGAIGDSLAVGTITGGFTKDRALLIFQAFKTAVRDFGVTTY
jgi:hypothetical protein